MCSNIILLCPILLCDQIGAQYEEIRCHIVYYCDHFGQKSSIFEFINIYLMCKKSKQTQKLRIIHNTWLIYETLVLYKDAETA